MTDRIYLDFAATTPLRPEAREAMATWLGPEFGNASSLYEEGRRAREEIDRAREVLSSALGCLFGEVVFVSSGTEAMNLALVGAALGAPSRRRVLMSAAEHHCAVNTAPLLERLGFVVEQVPVDSLARVHVEALEGAMGDDVLLVCAMHANNELGTFNDVGAVSALAKRHGALFVCDAVQTFPWADGERWTVDDLGADMVAVSAHKIGGPQGAGALYLRAGTAVKPVTLGGGQEREMRAGTENVAAIVGFAKAVECAVTYSGSCAKKAAVRNAFIQTVEGEAELTVRGERCLPGHLHVRFPGVSAESLLILLDRMGVSASAGAACSSGSIEPSHVLLACGWGERAGEGLRFTFGDQTTLEEAREAGERTLRAVRQIRERQSR